MKLLTSFPTVESWTLPGHRVTVPPEEFAQLLGRSKTPYQTAIQTGEGLRAEAGPASKREGQEVQPLGPEDGRPFGRMDLAFDRPRAVTFEALVHVRNSSRRFHIVGDEVTSLSLYFLPAARLRAPRASQEWNSLPRFLQ